MKTTDTKPIETPTKRQRMRRVVLPIISLLGLSLFSGSSWAANECRLKYKSGSAGFRYQNVDQGRTTSLTRSNFKEAYNVGRNDMQLTLEYVDVLGRTQSEKMTLIKSGSATIPLPPLPLINKKLKSIKCQRVATVTDTLNYTQRLGASASNIVSKATNDATTAINTAAQNTANLFSAQNANQLKAKSEKAISDVRNALAAAKRGANSAATNVRTNMARHFPEVNTAVTATGKYSWQVSDAIVSQGRQNIEGTLAKLNQLDRKYKVSQTASQLIAINLAKDFPELNALKNVQCRISNSPLVQFNGGLKKLRQELIKLDQKYKFSQGVKDVSRALITIPSASQRILKTRVDFKKCQKALDTLKKELASDYKLLNNYLNSVLRELKKLKSSQFKGQQAKFFQQVRKLITATEQLLREVKAQEKREADMEAAEKAHAKAFDRIKNDLGPIQDDLEKFPGGSLLVTVGLELKSFVPDWLTDNPRRTQQLLQAEIKAAEAYHKAIEEHENGKLKVKQKFNQWVKESTETLKLATQLKIKLPRNSQLLKVLKSVPKLKALDKAVDSSIKCIKDALNHAIKVSQIILDAIAQYQKNVTTTAINSLPSDLAAAMLELNASANALNESGVTKIVWDTIDKSNKKLNSTLSLLWKKLTQDPSARNFASEIDRLFKSLRADIIGLRKSGLALDKQVSQSQAAGIRFAKAVTKVDQLSKKYRRQLNADIRRLVQSAVGVEVNWKNVQALSKQVADCADKYSTPLERAIKSFSSRLATLIQSKVEVAANLIPKSVKDKLTATSNGFRELQSKFVTLQRSIADSKVAFQQFSSAQQLAINSLVPVPKSDAVSRTQESVNKLNNLNQKLTKANGDWANLNSAQQRIIRQLADLVSALNKQSNELRQDAQQLRYIAFNGNLIANQASGANNLVGLWGRAAQTLPGRIASLATGGLSSEIENQVNQGLSWMNGKQSALLSCISTAASKRSSITNNSQKVAAVNQTIAGLNAEALAVINSLKSLMPPSPNVLNQVNTILNRAKVFISRLDGIKNAASANFNSQVANLKSQLSQAKSCVTNNANQVDSKKAELLRLLNQGGTGTTRSRRRG